MLNEKATVWKHWAVSNDVLILKVIAPQIAASAKPGQFVQVKVTTNLDPLLRRSLSIHNVDTETGHVWLLYQIRGQGTRSLSLFREGDVLELTGPLGKGFDLDEKNAPFLILGGGIGIAPFAFVTKYLHQRSIPHKVIIGAHTANAIFEKHFFEALGAQPILATDDGSIGFHGNAVQAAEQLLSRETFKTILACGPHPMLRAAKEFAKQNFIDLQVSLEAKMACGVGACLGCTVKKAVGQGYYKVCKDGPVFASEEVDLDA